jgi:transcriptional regulator with XRE-family HTH domain
MNKLKFLRLSRGLSQWELAHQSDMSQGRLSMIERGFFPPTTEERERLAQILQVPAATLLRPACRVRRAHSPQSTASPVVI